MPPTLIAKKPKIAVIGLGYVGLPVALHFAEHLSVIGFDRSEERVEALKTGIDPARELDALAFKNRNVLFTSSPEVLKEAQVYIVTVPTPVNSSKVPDLTFLKKACVTIASVLKQGDYIIFESTVYPGCTEEECIPLVEQLSGLKMGEDFKAGYSPERINPGDKNHSLSNTVKIVSGCDETALEEIARLYELIIKAGVHRAPSIKIAEAAKIVENVQRDLNISLMNELSVIFDKMSINTLDVLDAAGTKWNFMKYFPGLVGGHCIGVDPYYLTYKAQQLGYNSKVIAAGRSVNDEMPHYISKKVVQHVIRNVENVSQARVLVLGATFKENVSDIRNSKVAVLVRDLLDYSLEVDFVDAHASTKEVKDEYGLDITDKISGTYDAVILAVAHDIYTNFSTEYLNSITRTGALFADLKGVYRGKVSGMKYWSL
ncbi:MAG: nucleotide sugar dehydrogenase [Chitinophagaceae bacterium]|nr:nucleotide sugar dehydrogenase [Chitinophagaceae bacterium]